MRIVNITTNATEATYPQKIVIDVVWDQVINSLQVENLIFEVENVPGITITGYDAQKDVFAPQAVFLGQTLVAKNNIRVLNPYTVQFSFQVSPFMQGTLRVSNQSWNKPLTLKVANANGVEGDWSPFLAPGTFSNVRCTGYYSAIDPTGTTSIDFNQPLQSQPRLKQQWTYSDPIANVNKFSAMNIKISDTNDFTVKPIVQWGGGNFWWWATAGCSYTSSPLNYPYGKYYSTNDTRTCSGPQGYVYTGAGGQVITTTQMPLYDAFYNNQTITNSFGSKLATNTRGGNSSTDYNWTTQPYLGNSPSNQGSGRNSGLGRMEGWVLANPLFGNPLANMPASWNDQRPNSVNLNCLAPWRLAKPTDPVPMLIQVYYQLNWLYSTASPVN